VTGHQVHVSAEKLRGLRYSGPQLT